MISTARHHSRRCVLLLRSNLLIPWWTLSFSSAESLKIVLKVYNGMIIPTPTELTWVLFTMNVTICKEMRMAMAHRLPHHDGQCKRLHGHTYVVRVYVCGPVQSVEETKSQSGMVVDFGVVKEFLKTVEACMDHRLGNETMDAYPTAERLALKVMAMAQEQLAPQLPPDVRVSRVRVYEEYVAPQAFAEVEA